MKVLVCGGWGWGIQLKATLKGGNGSITYYVVCDIWFCANSYPIYVKQVKKA